MRAIWYPYWYERDLPIHAGQIGEFEFFDAPPDYVKDDGLPVFWHDGHGPDRTHKEHLRILSIYHPELGYIESIDTVGLEYTVTMIDGRVLKLEAEEAPGTVYFLKSGEACEDGEPIDTPWMLQDWRFYVEAEKSEA
jgi:hypothetical protein